MFKMWGLALLLPVQTPRIQQLNLAKEPVRSRRARRECLEPSVASAWRAKQKARRPVPGMSGLNLGLRVTIGFRMEGSWRGFGSWAWRLFLECQ